MSAWYNKSMAFPSTYDFNYYKGDTFEFRIYPKKNDGTVFNLLSYQIASNTTTSIDGVEDSSAPYDSARFTIANVRGSTATTKVDCYARISDDGTFVQCAIRPQDSTALLAGTEYVYDVEVTKPSELAATHGEYPLVHTLLTGKITITDQVTGA